MDNNYKLIEEYYKLNRSNLIAYIYKKVKNIEDSEDILHNAFYRALRWNRTFSYLNGQIHQWMLSIIDNAIKDFKRKEKGQSADYVFEIVEEQDTLSIRDMDKYIDAIDSPLRKRIISLFVIENMKMVEIYRLLNIPYSTVKTIIRRFKNDIVKKGYV